MLTRSHVDDTVGQFECLFMTHLKCHAVVERRNLLLHRLDDLWVAMANAGGPQAGKRIVNAGAVRCGVVMPLGSRDQSRVFLEIAVGGKWHPVGVEFAGSSAHCSVLRSVWTITPV
jgi:hypothetical protein